MHTLNYLSNEKYIFAIILILKNKTFFRTARQYNLEPIGGTNIHLVIEQALIDTEMKYETSCGQNK